MMGKCRPYGAYLRERTVFLYRCRPYGAADRGWYAYFFGVGIRSGTLRKIGKGYGNKI